MAARTLKPGVYWVGAIDWDRRLFDELIPLPDGTSYNSYLIRGSEKVALIDTVYPPKKRELLGNLSELGISRIDYVIANHAEQDHSGSIPDILNNYPNAKVVTNLKCRDMLIDSLIIPAEKFATVKDREVLSLGDKTLEFIYAPWVHWPETMFTYLREDRILFSCDFLGSHLATSHLFATEDATMLEAAKRYYAEIMMPFRTVIKGNLLKIKELQIETIATSHGPVYSRPEFILDAYRSWVADEVKNEVVITYVSTYGSTGRMVDYLVDALIRKGVGVKLFNMVNSDIGELAMALVDAATIVIASPTMLVGPHPAVAYGAYLVNALRPKLRFMSIVGSYGWAETMLEQVKKILPNVRAEIIEPVVVKGYPRDDDFKALDRLAEEIFKRHRENNLL